MRRPGLPARASLRHDVAAFARRYVLRPTRRRAALHTNFSVLLYWNGEGEGAELTEAKRERWGQWLQDSLQQLTEQLPKPPSKPSRSDS